MTEEIIKSITNAEAKALEIKRVAQEQSARILADAEIRAEQILQTSAETCKAYRDEQLKQAVAQSEEEYCTTLKEEERKAKAYCATVLQTSEIVVSEIVGRIISGDR
ncbi:MAG: hypothetical protein J6A38_03110 [Clostridia bacterium]|nr:hypothetical protein [Clostridia bacterium]